MVEYNLQLDSVFQSLSDTTRRDMLDCLRQHQMSVGQLVKRYDFSFAAISKHLKVLEQAGLISKRKEGRKQIVSVNPAALKEADEYLEQYRRVWDSRFNKLDELLRGE